MPNVTSNTQYQQILSMAVEDRSSGYEDLVSNNNALLAVLRRKGLWQTYSGPKIRQTLQVGKQDAAAAPEAHDQTFQGARPVSHSSSSWPLSRIVSIGCQKPACS